MQADHQAMAAGEQGNQRGTHLCLVTGDDCAVFQNASRTRTTRGGLPSWT